MKDTLAYLTGRQEAGAAPVSIGRKFDAAGRVLPCAGNTMLCHVDPKSEAFEALSAAQSAMKSGKFAQAFAFLPPASLHMTIFEGVIDYARTADRWPGHIPLDASVAAVTDDVLQRLNRIRVPRAFQVKPTRLFGGFSVLMSGANSAAEAQLRSTRDQLRLATNLILPDHGSYSFHISFGYLLRWLADEDARRLQDHADAVFAEFLRPLQFTLGPVEFCRFNDMYRFEALARLT